MAAPRFKHVGLALGILRELKGLNQAALARKAGIGKSQLSKYENGKELPKFETLGKVLDALGSSPLTLFHVVNVLDVVAEGRSLDVLLTTARFQPLVSAPEERSFEKVIRELVSLFTSVVESRVSAHYRDRPVIEHEDGI